MHRDLARPTFSSAASTAGFDYDNERVRRFFRPLSAFETVAFGLKTICRFNKTTEGTSAALNTAGANQTLTTGYIASRGTS